MNTPLRRGARQPSPTLSFHRGHVARRSWTPARQPRFWRVGYLVATAALLCGCPNEKQSEAKTPRADQVARDTEIEHESCDLTSSSTKRLAVDAQGPSIIIVMDGGREHCRAIDLNRDGAIDAFRYFDGSGLERRREGAFGRSGLPSEVSLFQGGVLVRKELETNADARLDTWQYFEGGRLTREERDSTGDGYIDQWWTFNRPNMPDCAIVLSDENGDGKPEDSSRIDMCEGVEPPPPAAASSAAAATDGTVPTNGTVPSNGTVAGDGDSDAAATPDGGSDGAPDDSEDAATDGGAP